MGVVAAVKQRIGVETLRGAGPMYPLVVLFGLNAVDELDQAAFRVLSPEIRDHFGLSNTEIAAIAAALVPVVVLLGLPIGFAADRFRRTRMAGGGALMWGVFSVATGLAPVVAVLFVARAASGLGRAVNQPTHQGLLADYYAPEHRVGIYSLWRMANPVGQFVGPLLAGGIAVVFGWRWPFVLLAVPTFVFVLLSTRLHEPVRGEQERRARGADEDLVGVEEEPPTWDEAWRALNGVQTLRRIWRAAPFLLGGLLGFFILLPLYYEDVLGVDEFGRGVLAAINEPFTVAGLLIAMPVATRMVRTRPDRVLHLFAAAATVAACGLVIIAVAPNVVVAAAGSVVIALAMSVIPPGFAAVASLIIPPRARSFGFSIGDIWALPGLFFVIVAAAIGDTYGLRIGMLAMIPVFLTGAYIVGTAGSKVRIDIRNAQLASVAQAESKRARDRGEAKLLVCRGVDVHYGPVQVLFDVDFDVNDGEIVALLGTNGAGKSTLLKAIAGIVEPTGGSIVFDGRDITHSTPQQTFGRGVIYIPGGRSVFPTLTVAENLRVAGWSGRREPEELGAGIEDVLDRFPQLRNRIDEPAGNLSGGEQQMLGLGIAFLARPTLLMIDELSLGLAPKVVAELLDAVRELHRAGTTVVLVEQSVNVALTVARRAVFLEKGEVRFEGDTAVLLERDDVLRSVFLEGASRNLGNNPDAGSRSGGNGHRAASNGARSASDRAVGHVAEPALVVEHASKRFGGVTAVNDVSFTVPQGSVAGFIGPNGAGKTTLFDMISGYVVPDEGRVVVNRADVTRWRPDRRATNGLGRSFQDARLFPSMTVREAIASAHHRHLQQRSALAALAAVPDQRVEELILGRRVDELIEVLGLGAYADKFVHELSTGSRRIVDIACSIAHGPDVLLLDEPSSGIAQREAEALVPLLRSVREWLDVTLLVIEHDMPLISEIADELHALDLGELVVSGAPEAALAHPRVVASYLGGDESAIRRTGTGRPSPLQAHGRTNAD